MNRRRAAVSYVLWLLATASLLASMEAGSRPPSNKACPGIDPLCGFGEGFNAAFGSFLYGLAAIVLALLGLVAYVASRRSS